MNNNNDTQINLLYIQFYTSLIYSLAIIVSIILTHNDILKFKGMQFIDDKEENDIIMINRIVLTIISIIFLYISYEYYISSDKKRDKLQVYELVASLLNFISSFILVYTTFKNYKNDSNGFDINNPYF